MTVVELLLMVVLGLWNIRIPRRFVPKGLRKAIHRVTMTFVVIGLLVNIVATGYLYASPPTRLLVSLPDGWRFLSPIMIVLLAALFILVMITMFFPAAMLMDLGDEKGDPIVLLAGIWACLGPWLTMSKHASIFGVALMFLGQSSISLLIGFSYAAGASGLMVLGWRVLVALSFVFAYWVYLYLVGGLKMGLAWRDPWGMVIWHVVLWIGTGGMARMLVRMARETNP